MKHIDAPPFSFRTSPFNMQRFFAFIFVTYALTSNIRFCYQAIQKFTMLMTFELYRVPHTFLFIFHINFLLGKLEENNEDLMRQEKTFSNLFAIVCALLKYENIIKKVVLHASFISSFSPSCFLFQICLINKTQSKGKCLFKFVKREGERGKRWISISIRLLNKVWKKIPHVFYHFIKTNKGIVHNLHWMKEN